MEVVGHDETFRKVACLMQSIETVNVSISTRKRIFSKDRKIVSTQSTKVVTSKSLCHSGKRESQDRGGAHVKGMVKQHALQTALHAGKRRTSDLARKRDHR